MKGTIALLFGAAVASPLAQRQSSDCQSDVPEAFQIAVVNQTSTAKRDLQRRQLSGDLMLTINGGILKDQAGRTGYIASANDQFQFDSPPQEGAIGASGWSLCGQNLALNGDTTFYQCLSGDFYNLYKDSQGGQCVKIYMQSLAGGSAPVSSPAAGGQPPASTAAPATQINDGQPQASTAGAVSQIVDGQPQASTAAPVSQIVDGQPQASTAAPAVTQISDGQVQASTAAAVTQISDGQVQASTAAPAVTQISDGQVQASTAPAVTQISDGQVQASSAAAPVTQISDGQVQASTAAVTQITDGQVQAPTAVTQITDGQVQAPTGSATMAVYTGAADRNLVGSFAFAAGIVGAVAML
ncbi:hypothetical protein LTR70_004748 [Exophiala xenobiotica]|uniref:Cell wall mannoprotein PIR1-like C-terminal domain-containing protein n=1 Tax=Lithohypha guttulata TaxID=1690604 RepID=A0ABR0KCL8_9EURO|nr:hypothetical protein LTR24_004364 [Lithohypha guttulata]KAK5319962.1 hypothetical protein LTR70_004748 [Exophiala xenobiotica]